MPENTDTPGVYIDEVNSIASHIAGVSTSTTAFIDIFKKGPIGKATPISRIEEFTDIFGGVDIHSEASYGIYQFFLNGGLRAMVVRVPGRKPPDKRAIISGLKILASEKQDSINILCIPAAANLKERSMRLVYASAIEYCEANRAFLIIDISERVGQPDQMIEWVRENTALCSRNAAVYFPRIEIQEPIDPDQMRTVSPGGTIAGIFARTDFDRGVWKAPAGNAAVLKGALGLGYVLTDDENGVLNSKGINCIRNFPERGYLCWGARTLEGNDQNASEWKYIYVRRLVLFIEESVDRGTKWVVFEPNDQQLWAQIRIIVGVFMQNLFRTGAFQGSSPRDAYFVKCDSETTTQADIDSGIVNINIGFAPLKPSEFILIRIRQRAGNSTKLI